MRTNVHSQISALQKHIAFIWTSGFQKYLYLYNMSWKSFSLLCICNTLLHQLYFTLNRCLSVANEQFLCVLIQLYISHENVTHTFISFLGRLMIDYTHHSLKAFYYYKFIITQNHNELVFERWCVCSLSWLYWR